MKLRKLKPEDAPRMLEWMHDPDCVGKLQSNFMDKTLEDCQGFIAYSLTAMEDLHLAIADDADAYVGTVSLKHIDTAGGCAEFAIAVHPCVMGTGVAHQAMEAILHMGLTQLGLQNIYWCVSPENKRAVRFYDKHSYPRIDGSLVPGDHYTPEQIRAYIWYRVER